MSCKSCGSVNAMKLNAEMNLHFRGHAGLDAPTVWLFPEVVVCLDCGFAEFSVPERELRDLQRSPAA